MMVNRNELKKDLDQALEKGWSELHTDKDYELTKDYFNELLHSDFFEKKFRGKIANPAHDHAVKLMGKYVNPVLAKYSIVLEEFYPGDFHTSTGEEIKNDPNIPLYEHRIFHNKAWHDGKVLCNLHIVVSHIRGQFEFPYPPFITLD